MPSKIAPPSAAQPDADAAAESPASSAGGAGLWIVTGSSRGLGAALLDACLTPGARVLGVARGEAPDALARARARDATLEQWRLDLADAPSAAERLRAWLAAIDPAGLGHATLVNNAATVGGPGALDRLEPARLTEALRVGLEAAVLLSAAFIDATRGWGVPRRILNVSSGLGRRAMADTAVYCAVKAGLDHFSRALALEQARESDGVRVASVAPGVVDTDMQVTLRGTDPSAFAAQPQFDALHRTGQLTSPDAAAARLLALLAREDYGREAVADVRG